MLLVACAPAPAPSPTVAPTKPTEAPAAKPAAELTKPAAAPTQAPATAPAVSSKRVLFGSGITAPYSPFVVGVEKGFMQQHGVNAEYKLFESGVPGLEAVIAGQAEVGMASEFTFGPMVSKTDKLSLVSIGNITGKDLGAVVSSKIGEPKELEGKSVATALKTSAQYWMNKFFEYHKVDASKVDVKNVGPPEMLPALARGDVDAYFVWGVWIPKGPEVVPGARIIAYSGDNNVFLQKQGLLFNADFVNDNLETAVNTLKGLDLTFKWIKNNPEEASTIAANAFRVNPSDFRPQVEPVDFVARLLQEDIAEYKASTKWMIEQGTVTLKPDETIDQFWQRAVDLRPIKQAVPGATDITNM
jgi:ABC-type nitrate/sulfonate/bicarbonate transport system substrate-binding protein